MQIRIGWMCRECELDQELVIDSSKMGVLVGLVSGTVATRHGELVRLEWQVQETRVFCTVLDFVMRQQRGPEITPGPLSSSSFWKRYCLQVPVPYGQLNCGSASTSTW